MKDKFEAVLNKGEDVAISMISGCDSKSMDWCEEHCRKYYDCHTIAMANDLLKEFEDSRDVMLIKRNMYARTNDGFIIKLKILTINNRGRNWIFDGFYPSNNVAEKNIIKTSNKVIDLVEVGDLVNGKRVLTVLNEGFMVEDCNVILKDEVKDVLPASLLEFSKIKVKE